MNTTLNQLIAEMRHAATLFPKPLLPEDSCYADFVVIIQRFPERTMSQWFELDTGKFPEADFWSEEELELLANEFELLWHAWSFSPVFPEALPAKMRYTLMRNHLDHSLEVYTGGTEQDIHFCGFMIDQCPFGPELCMCKKALEENTVYI